MTQPTRRFRDSCRAVRRATLMRRQTGSRTAVRWPVARPRSMPGGPLYRPFAALFGHADGRGGWPVLVAERAARHMTGRGPRLGARRSSTTAATSHLCQRGALPGGGRCRRVLPAMRRCCEGSEAGGRLRHRRHSPTSSGARGRSGFSLGHRRLVTVLAGERRTADIDEIW